MYLARHSLTSKIHLNGLRYPLVDNIEQEQSLYLSFIELRLDSPWTTRGDEEAVRPCRLRQGPPNDRHQAGGR